MVASANSDGEYDDGGSGTRPAANDSRHETEDDRLDRNFDELLQELRVTQTGTQILFAFLLGVAYTDPFRSSDDYVHAVYSVTLLLCALATGLLIAPVALHRTLFRLHRKGSLVAASAWLARFGIYVLLCALVCAVALALDDPIGRAAAQLMSAVVLLVLLALWVLLPLWVKSHRSP